MKKYIMQFLVDGSFDRQLAIKLLEAYGAKHLSTDELNLQHAPAAPQQERQPQPHKPKHKPKVQRISLGRLKVFSRQQSFGPKRRSADTPRARGVTPHELILPLLHSSNLISPSDIGAALHDAGYSYKSKSNYLRDFVVMGFLERVAQGVYRATPKGLELRDTRTVDWPSNAALDKAWSKVRAARAGQAAERRGE